MKVVCDSNVFLSAILFGGNPEKIIQAALNQEVDLITSYVIILECVQKLSSKFKWSDAEVQVVVIFWGTLCTVVKPTVRINRIHQDPSDNRVLECAITAQADFIVSGDKRHLLPLKQFRSIPILSPVEFLTRILYR